MEADFLLIRKMKQGDDSAFEIFVRRYYETILKYCMYHCGDPGYAEDLTQETFVRFFAGLSRYRHTGKALNYLYAIAGNLCRDYHKRTRDIPTDPADGMFLSESTADSSIPASGDLEKSITERLLIRQALKHLPDELLEVTDMYYFREMKVSEIASALHIGHPLAKYRLRRARQELQKLLTRKEDTKNDADRYSKTD